MAERKMFYGASPRIFENAKALRSNMTLPEKKLWEKLKGKQFMGLRFRRQHPLSSNIADFYCHQLKLVIEVDGEIHKNSDQEEYDVGRTSELRELGIYVIRYTNNQINENLDLVLDNLTKEVQMLTLVQQSPLQGI